MKYLMSSVILMCYLAQAHALGGLADVRVIARDSGAVLQAYYYRGEYWVAGNPGERYAIEIKNRLGERILAVTSVDGVNVVSGETAAWGQTGYVFDGGEDYRITGWRKSDAEVAAFAFTSAANSYAERTGRPHDVGVIGVALFRERQVAPVRPESPMFNEYERSLDKAAGEAGQRAAAPSASLGTAHGPRESSYVAHTEFERQQSQPNEVIRIRYDSMANLVAMGVVRRPRPPQPNPFPENVPNQYVPDPPG